MLSVLLPRMFFLFNGLAHAVSVGRCGSINPGVASIPSESHTESPFGVVPTLLVVCGLLRGVVQCSAREKAV